jgi:tetratricopeptide (TPR) repeat protein
MVGMSAMPEHTPVLPGSDQKIVARPSDQALRDRTLLFHIHGDYQVAADGYAELLSRNPADPEALLNISAIYEEAGRMDIANQMWEALLEVEDAEAIVDYLLARHLALTGEKGKGRKAMARAIEKEPDNALFHNFYGLILLEDGLLYDAHRELKEAVRLEPNNLAFLKSLGLQCVTEYLFAGTGVVAMERALEISPDDPDILETLVQLYYRNLRYRDAADCVMRLESLGKVSVFQQLLRLSSLLAIGAEAEAQAVINSLLSLSDRLITLQSQDDPRKAMMHQGFKARVQMLIGHKDEAKKTLQEMSAGWSYANYDFSVGRYLPDFFGRIERLRKIVAGRDIAILAHGPSLSGFEKSLKAFKDVDFCYFGLNRFQLTEEHLLHKIGRELDVIAVTPPHMMKDIIGAVSEFLNRPNDNLLVTTHSSLGALASPFPTRDDLERTFNERMLYFESSSQAPPSPVEPFDFVPCNTLSVLICVAALALPRRIFIFGADGGVVGGDKRQTHFKKDSDEFVFHLPDNFDGVYADAIHADTQEFNEIWDINLSAICALYDLPRPEIYNVNPDSLTSIEPKISYEQCIELVTDGSN